MSDSQNQREDDDLLARAQLPDAEQFFDPWEEEFRKATLRTTKTSSFDGRSDNARKVWLDRRTIVCKCGGAIHYDAISSDHVQWMVGINSSRSGICVKTGVEPNVTSACHR